jgi:transketolase
MTLNHLPLAELRRLRALSASAVERTGLFADACRFNCLYMIMKAGSGHIGSSFSAMDIVSWVHLDEFEAGEGSPVFFSSKGHDAPGYYSVLLGLERLDYSLLHQLRRLGGLPGHPDVGTPGIAANTGSLGMGISKAKGMIHAARNASEKKRIYVLLGDGELQEGQIWESLQGAVTHKMGELTIIVDHNKLQSDTWVETVSSLGDLEAKFAAFGWEVARCDGHDLAALAAHFEAFRKIGDKPKILIADTVKGRGVSFMEKTTREGSFDMYKFHSGAPSVTDYNRASEEILTRINSRLSTLGHPAAQVQSAEVPDRAPPVGQRLVPAYGTALLEEARQNEKIVVLDADLMLDCGIIPFREALPDRFIECGIAEQDMVSQAGGLALGGRLPIVHSFSCFLTTRANEQIYNNATEHTKLIYVGSLAGILPAAPGHSHQCVRDISVLAAIPEMILFEPSCEEEAGMGLRYCVREAAGSCFIRLVSVPCDIPYLLPEAYAAAVGRGCVLREGSHVVVFSYGPVLLPQAFHAARLLDEKNISVRVVNLPWLNRVEPSWLQEVTDGCRLMVTLDNQYRHGGQGDMLCRAVLETLGAEAPVVLRLGLDEVPACGQPAEVLAHHGLDAASIAQRIADQLAGLA